jgi:CO/xanthine dehydrogenase FAD-binding subunit
VVRLRKTEAACVARTADIAAALEKDIAPIDDVRSTAAYRRHVTANLLSRFLSEGADRV